MVASQRAAAPTVSGPKEAGAAGRRLLLVAGGILVTWGAHNALLLPWEVRHIDAGIREAALVVLRAVVWMVPVVLYLDRYDPRPRLVALGVTSAIHRRGLAWSALVGAIYLSLVGMLVTGTAPQSNRPDLFATLAQVSVLCSLLASVLEELLMRGFLLGQLMRFTTSLRAQAFVAILFGLMHLPGWIALEGVSIDLVPSTLMIMVLGAVLGGIACASRSILPAIFLHCANNFLGEWLGGR
ncbi:MAG TPA: CPBP family intramembrane glutamic endopeptidase [Polyangiaceae bacterium]|nr:CPBP family intramembrane glutamic endopeptidase [Polyangiaceae bacterium]